MACKTVEHDVFAGLVERLLVARRIEIRVAACGAVVPSKTIVTRGTVIPCGTVVANGTRVTREAIRARCTVVAHRA
jgi:hypothetical protein